MDNNMTAMQPDSVKVPAAVHTDTLPDAVHGGGGGVLRTEGAQPAEQGGGMAVWQDTTAICRQMADAGHGDVLTDSMSVWLPAVGEDSACVELPQYYRQNFFSGDSVFFYELGADRYGVMGDPVPYSIRGDNTITALLLAAFVLSLMAYSKSRRFVQRQVKSIFHEPSDLTTELSESSSEYRFQFFFALQTCLLLSIMSFLYTHENVADTFMLSSHNQLLAIFFGAYVAYFAVKSLLYWLVNTVFFGKRRCARWLKLFLFVMALEGFALFPMVMLQSFFDMSVHNAAIYVAFVIIIVKLLLLYKSYVIFFKKTALFLQIILYFCALEIIPLLSLWGVLVMIVDRLKINF